MPEIKIVDFKKIGALHKHYGSEWGEYDPNTDTIRISRLLGDRQIPAKLDVILHEKCHRRIAVNGVNKYFTEVQEEAFCDLWSIMWYPKKRIW